MRGSATIITFDDLLKGGRQPMDVSVALVLKSGWVGLQSRKW